MTCQNRLNFSLSALSLLFFLLVNLSLYAQSKEEKKAEKRLKKEQLVTQQRESTIRYMLFFEQQQFIFKANSFDADGVGYQLDPDVNFFAVDSVYGRFQVVIDNHVTENGINTTKFFGDVRNSMDGLVDNVSYQKAKNELGFAAKVMFKRRRGGPTGIGIIVFNVTPEGDAKVSVTGLFYEKLTFSGKIIPLKPNHIYDTLVATNFYDH